MSNVAKGFESFFCIIYHNQCHLSEIDKTCEMEKPIQWNRIDTWHEISFETVLDKYPLLKIQKIFQINCKREFARINCNAGDVNKYVYRKWCEFHTNVGCQCLYEFYGYVS